MTVGEAVAACEARLAVAGVDSARLDAQVLVAHALGVERPWVLAHGGDALPSIPGLESLCERRERREPLAYILGWREFYGRRFVVTRDVLVPRQETETLVAAALAQEHVHDVLDVGTGSGCVALTLALERPEWRVTATDVSKEALAIARRNAEALIGEARPPVRFVRSDLFSALSGNSYDLIVTNPPYVAVGDALPPEVRDYEPPTALYAGEDGLAVFRRLAEEAHGFLRTAGVLATEVGDGQSEAVRRVFEDHGWTAEGVLSDLSGEPRVIVVRPLHV